MDGRTDHTVRPLTDCRFSADADDTSWVSVCPRGLWKVQQKSSVRQAACPSGGDASPTLWPSLGSLCRVRVCLEFAGEKHESAREHQTERLTPSEKGRDRPVDDITKAMPTAFPRCLESVLQVPLGNWTVLRLGEGQCDVTESCVERMRAGEKCEILISPIGNAPEVPISHPPVENEPLQATVELQTCTPGKESWEMSTGEKWEWVKSHKERGGVRFRGGDLWGAADSYSRALKLLITIQRHFKEASVKGQEEEQRDWNAGDGAQSLPSVAEYKTTKAELHSNLSLCQLKLNLPERARNSAARATELDPAGAKAWYRLGQACQMVNDLEEARQAFRKLLELQPDSPAALKALKNIASREKETNTQLGLRLSKMFS
ncbi:FK506-binding protein-like [Nelusetta ayraudi]|uniref:FK506-binding protein-like n=1 Tax=Nelusetta ayraudi TaxID=303726 RepID=UPI003F728516